VLDEGVLDDGLVAFCSSTYGQEGALVVSRAVSRDDSPPGGGWMDGMIHVRWRNIMK
jgi:hypothetical protein